MLATACSGGKTAPLVAERTKTPAEIVGEFRELVVGYAKQETIDPLKRLGRYLGFGLGGALALGLGVLLLLLALLRGLQELDVFTEPTLVGVETTEVDVDIDVPGRGSVEGVTLAAQQPELEPNRFSWAPYAITAVAGLVVVGVTASRIPDRSRRREEAP